MIVFWSIVILACIVLEAASAALVSIWFIPGGIVALILELCGVSEAIQYIVFVVLSAFLLILSKTVFKKYMKKVETVPTNTDRIIGMDAIVTKDIPGGDTEFGEVKVDGKIWRAQMIDQSSACADTVVVVDRVDSTKVICAQKS